MTTPITIFASATLEAAQAGEPRRFKISPAYAGGALVVSGYGLPIVPDLAGMQADENVVLNLDHKSEARIGHCTDVANDGRSLRLGGIVSAATEAAREFTESAQRGFPWAASIECQPGAIEEVSRGSTATANGRVFQGPIQIARKSRLYAVA